MTPTYGWNFSLILSTKKSLKQIQKENISFLKTANSKNIRD